jgi:hypothetical protein
MTFKLFEHFIHITLHIEILNTIETQQQLGLTVSEEALFNTSLHRVSAKTYPLLFNSFLMRSNSLPVCPATELFSSARRNR